MTAVTDAYVRSKVREAMVAAKGGRTTAQRLLMEWAEQDPRLLLGMARPFLKAVAAAALQTEMRRMDAGSRRAETTGGGNLSRDALAQVLSRMGEEPSAAARNGTRDGGQSSGMRSATMTISSRAEAAAKSGDLSHERSMMAIAKAFAAKKMG